MPDNLYRRLLVKHDGDAAQARLALQTIYGLLLADAQKWWYHRELRKQGQVDEARRLELASVRSSVETLTSAVYAHIVALGGGWVIYKRAKKYPDGGYSTGTLEGYGGIESPVMRCCVLLGIPVLDFSAEGCSISGVLRIPAEKRPAEVSPRYSGTLGTFIAECLAAGARLVTGEVTG